MNACEEIDGYLEKNRGEFTAVSDQIWDAAELGLREYRSARILLDKLEEHGFRTRSGLAGIPTAFVGEWGSGRPVLAILGEFDALPTLSQVSGLNEKQPLVEGGPGHGCMHNLLGTASLAAAVAARTYMEAHNIPGTLRYYGCPGEEHGCGKVFMTRAGVFQDVDCALSWHPDDCTTPWSTGNSALITVDFHFTGKSAHAARAPHLGRSALDACELMNVGSNYLREHMPPNTKLHYAYKDAGGPAPNIVPASACVSYVVRGPRIGDVVGVLDRVVKIAQGAALMTETEMAYEYQDGTSEYMPNLTLCRILSDALHQVGAPRFDDEDRRIAEEMRKAIPPQNIRGRDPFMSGYTPEEAPEFFASHPLTDRVADMLEASDTVIPSSTDVGAVSYVVPTAQIAVACKAIGTPNHTWLTTAQGKTSIGHKGMLTAGKALALGAVTIFEQDRDEAGALMARAKAELMRKTGCRFVAPFPDSIQPDVEPDATI